MRDVLDFYKRRPVLGAALALLGLLLALAVATVARDRPVQAVLLAVLVGLVIGGALAAGQRRP